MRQTISRAMLEELRRVSYRWVEDSDVIQISLHTSNVRDELEGERVPVDRSILDHTRRLTAECAAAAEFPRVSEYRRGNQGLACSPCPHCNWPTETAGNFCTWCGEMLKKGGPTKCTSPPATPIYGRLSVAEGGRIDVDGDDVTYDGPDFSDCIVLGGVIKDVPVTVVADAEDSGDQYRKQVTDAVDKFHDKRIADGYDPLTLQGRRHFEKAVDELLKDCGQPTYDEHRRAGD